jgi:DNA-binding transcriptional MerR regulator/methylmalonyl-CoA mutase cobalamin-binding subunit
MNSEKRFPIKTVAQKTGLSAHVIRAWEKRYQVVKPLRSETNRRLYSHEDIRLLSLLKKATQSGHSISSISDLDINALQQLLQDRFKEEQDDPHVYDSESIGGDEAHFDNCLNAIKELDAARFEEALLRASMDLTQPVLIKSLLLPLIRSLGELWKDGSLRVMHEHLATAVLKPFLHNLRISYRPSPNAPSMIIATPIGQMHEFGALIIGLVTASEGWKVIYLGPNLPAEEIASATKQKKSNYALLSLVYPANDPYLRQELEKLRTLLPSSVKIIIGGRVSESYQEIIKDIDALQFNDLDEFRQYLELQQQY